jgi:hypothetical protein
MSFINIDLDDIQEPQPVPDGDYEVQIVDIPEVKTSNRTGQEYLNFRLQILNEPGAADIYDVVMLPASQESEESNTRRKLRLKRMCEAFGVSYSGGSIQLEAFNGLRARALLSVESDAEFGDKNRVRRYMAL